MPLGIVQRIPFGMPFDAFPKGFLEAFRAALLESFWKGFLEVFLAAP